MTEVLKTIVAGAVGAGIACVIIVIYWWCWRGRA